MLFLLHGPVIDLENSGLVQERRWMARGYAIEKKKDTALMCHVSKQIFMYEPLLHYLTSFDLEMYFKSSWFKCHIITSSTIVSVIDTC